MKFMVPYWQWLSNKVQSHVHGTIQARAKSCSTLETLLSSTSTKSRHLSLKKCRVFAENVPLVVSFA
jgi:hypothetical protein